MSDASPLVSVAWLAAHLEDPGLVVVDASWHMPDSSRSGGKEFLEAHIPGAVFFDIDAVSDRTSPLPHMLPDAPAFPQAAGALGISERDTIVVYDAVGLFSAPRAWWTLQVFGTADVKVEYVGRAPLDGHDDEFLLASYRPGKAGPDPSDGLPTGVMIAMNGTTPSDSATSPFPGVLSDAQPQAPEPVMMTASMDGFDTGAPESIQLELPELGPIVSNRPDEGEIAVAALSLSYGPSQKPAGGAFPSAFAGPDTGWKSGASPEAANDYVMVGSFHDEAEARRLEKALSALGRTEMHSAVDETGTRWFALDLYPDGRSTPDAMLEAAWSLGAEDAMTVHF